jgi:hypothetical protein
LGNPKRDERMGRLMSGYDIHRPSDKGMTLL